MLDPTCHTPRKVYETDAGYANLEGAYVLLDMPILKAHTSYRLPLFLPTDGRNAVRATAASAIASAEASYVNERKKALVFNTALVFIVLQDGVAKAESQYQTSPFSNEMIRLTSFGRVPNYWSWSSALASHLGYDARYVSHAFVALITGTLLPDVNSTLESSTVA
jgi:hypothetical protein